MGLDSKPKTLVGEKNKLEKEGVDGARLTTPRGRWTRKRGVRLDQEHHQKEDKLENERARVSGARP